MTMVSGMKMIVERKRERMGQEDENKRGNNELYIPQVVAVSIKNSTREMLIEFFIALWLLCFA